MAILKIITRTGILFVAGILQTIGVVAEGFIKLLTKTGEYLKDLDNNLDKMFEKKSEKSKKVST
jgi:hypothetical protein